MWTTPSNFQICFFLFGWLVGWGFFCERFFWWHLWFCLYQSQFTPKPHLFFNLITCIFMPCSTKYLCMYLWSPLKEWDYSFAGFDTSSGTLLNWGLNILHYIWLPLPYSEFIIHIEYYREIYIYKKYMKSLTNRIVYVS